MLITHEILRWKRACAAQRAIFRDEWPDGVEVTVEAFARARELGLDVQWTARLLPWTLWMEYERQRAPLLAEYEGQAAALWAEYDRQRAPLLAEYDRQEAPIWAEYERQKAPLLAEYERQRAALWAEYERQEAPIWAEYERQKAPLWAEYERQRAALLVALLNQSEVSA